MKDAIKDAANYISEEIVRKASKILARPSGSFFDLRSNEQESS